LIVEVIMPKIGMYEDDVTLIEWLVDDGSRVDVGEPLFVMETEKVATEIECEDEGIIVVEAAAGFSAPVGSRIGYIVSTDDEHRELRARLDVPT
jgi:pyruvate/2-oxoglutarate dehydrogenase complex dihydrolipoamide acyltransferase (E2) component